MAFTPPGNLSTNASLAHLASVYYDRTALSSLRKKFLFWKGVDTRTLPKKNGKTIQFYRYSQLGANTTVVDEGTTGNVPVTMTSGTVSATVAQYADFISFSDMLVDIAIDGDIVAVGADQLGYRAGLTVDNILRNELDSVAASIDVSLLGDYFTAADGANIRARMAGLDIRPFSRSGYFPCLMHPYVSYDFIHDPQVGGFMDVVKQSGADQRDRLYSIEDRGLIGRFAGVEYWESTNVTLVAGSPNKYRNYFFGMEGIAGIDLAGRGPTHSEDQDRTKFSINVINETKPTIANPEGKIRALASYNFVFVAKVLDTNPYRLRKIDAPTSLGL